MFDASSNVYAFRQADMSAPPIGHNNSPAIDDDSATVLNAWMLLDAIDAMKANSGIAQAEYTPEEIGALPGYSRTSAIRSATTFQLAALCRMPPAARTNSQRSGALLDQIALFSDNEHGRCTIGIPRLAEYLGCSVRHCQSLIMQCISDGLVDTEVRPGRPAALWLRYPHAVVGASAIQISEAIAPPRAQPGRPPSSDKPRKSCVPGFDSKPSEKPLNSSDQGFSDDQAKTPEVLTENPGTEIDKPRNYSGSDSKNSLQDLNARQGSEVLANSRSPRPEQSVLFIDGVKPAKPKPRATGKRPWDWVHKNEKRDLFEQCREFAEDRGWSPEFLAERLKAFANRQKSRPTASADWWAELELWLGNPLFQPKGVRRSGRLSRSDLMDEVPDDGGFS